MKLLVTRIAVMKNGLLAVFAVGMLVGPMAVQAAPGGVTEGLKVWLRADTGISANDGEAVEFWADQSGEGNDAVFDPVNGFGESAPVLVASNPGVAGRPTVRFNNVNALELDLGFLVGSDYTIFVVNGRDRIGVANFYIAGDSGVLNTNLVLGYETEAQLRQSHFSNDLNAFVPEYLGSELWQMDTFTFDQTSGRTIYQDGVARAADTNLVPLTANTGTTLGHFRAFGNLYWFQGDLAEVVIYDRALSGTERRAIEAELGVLYGRPSPDIIYESATLGQEGQSNGTIIDGLQYLGSRFELTETFDITAVGGHLGNFGGTLFAAIIPLASFDALPTTIDIPSIALAIVYFDDVGTSANRTFPIETTLDPGVYGLVFGGTNPADNGFMPSDGVDLPRASYFVKQYSGEWQDDGLFNTRFFVEGRPAEELDGDGDGIVGDADLCPATLPGDLVDVNGCSANEAVDLVVAAIFTLIDSPVSDKARDKLGKAQDKLNDALTELAQDDVKKGLKKIGDAVKELLKSDKEGVNVGDLIGQLVELARAQAQAKIDEAIAAGGDSKKIAKARNELSKAEAELADGKPDKAIDHYAKAWDQARKA